MNCGVYSSFVYIFVCLILIGHAAPKPYVMPDVTMEWGSGEAKVNCFKKEDLGIPNITRTNLYYTKCLGGENDAAIVNRINGKVTYIGGSNESVQLNDDGSISLPGDYRSIGEYSCSYWRSTSFTKTLTKVDIFEPPLRVLECNATTKPNQSKSTCQVNVPNGTRSLNFTVIKEGLRWSRPILVVLPSNVSILTETNDSKTNADNSTTKSWGYEVDVSELTSTSILSFVMEGPTKEEISVVLFKAEHRSDSNLTSGQIGGIASGVIVAVLTGLVILYVLVRSNKKCRTAFNNCFRNN